MEFIDLYAGSGCFHKALQNIGKCVYACEIDEHARKTYLNNFSVDVFDKDIRTVNPDSIPNHDLLCAGFPCQPFSLAGKQEGFNHKDGNLFLEIVKILKCKNPKYFLLENVKNLLSHDKGNTFKIILHELTECGYYVKYKILNSLTHGNLPHNRERIFIVGFKNKLEADLFQFPSEILLTINLFGDIINLSEKANDNLYQTNTNSPSIIKMINEITEKGFVYQYRRYYIRKNKNGVCPTLTANMGTGGHNVPLILDDFGIRKLSPKECFSLQGFPDIKFPNISNSMLFKQAGNAVPIPLVLRIIENILK